VTYPGITATGTGTWSFAAPAEPSHGYGLTLRIEVTNGEDVSSTVIGVGYTSQIAAGETFERDATFGWLPQLNANTRGGATAAQVIAVLPDATTSVRGLMTTTQATELGDAYAHISDASAAHAASAISATATGWLGSTNQQAVNAEIVTDLAATTDGASGAIRIGAPAVTGTNYSLTAGTVEAQLETLAQQTDDIATTTLSYLSSLSSQLRGHVWMTSGKSYPLYSVAYSPTLKLFCAVGGTASTSAYILTSPDGITWTQRTSAISSTYAPLTKVFWSTLFSRFICISGTSTTAANAIQTSTDGITWTKPVSDTTTVVLGGSTEFTYGYTSGSMLFIMPATPGVNAVAVTYNGTTWATITLPSGFFSSSSLTINRWSYHTGAAKLVGVGYNGGSTGNIIYYSNAGTAITTASTWTSITSTNTACTFHDIAYGGGWALAVGYAASGTCVYSSNNATTWNACDNTATNLWKCVAYDSETTYFVSMSASGTGDSNHRVGFNIGINTTTFGNGHIKYPGYWRGIAYGNGMLVAVGDRYSGSGAGVIASSGINEAAFGL